MVSMKIKGSDDYPMPEDNPYGYGLRICLTDEQVDALGLASNPPAAGSKVNIRAMAVVVRKSENVDAGDEDNDVDVVLEFQITDMEVVPEGGSMDPMSLYG